MNLEEIDMLKLQNILLVKEKCDLLQKLWAKEIEDKYDLKNKDWDVNIQTGEIQIKDFAENSNVSQS